MKATGSSKRLIATALWRWPWAGAWIDSAELWLSAGAAALIGLGMLMSFSAPARADQLGQLSAGAFLGAIGVARWSGWLSDPKAIALISGALIGSSVKVALMIGLWKTIEKQQGQKRVIEAPMDTIVELVERSLGFERRHLKAWDRPGKAGQAEQAALAAMILMGAGSIAMLAALLYAALFGWIMSLTAGAIAIIETIRAGAIPAGIAQWSPIEAIWMGAQPPILLALLSRAIWLRARAIAAEPPKSQTPVETSAKERWRELRALLQKALSETIQAIRKAPSKLKGQAQSKMESIARAAVEKGRASGALADWEKGELESQSKQSKPQAQKDPTPRL